MPYIEPNDVISPRTRWKLIAVLDNRGPSEIAYALGEWDGEPKIAVRWNGDDEHPIGNPQSRGLPTWTMLDQDLYLPIMQNLPTDKQLLARTLLDIEVYPVVELKIDHHPSGRHTLKKRVSGQQMYQDCSGSPGLFGNVDKLEFLKAYCSKVKKHMEDGSRVILHDF
ncbi:MAG: hypothetical protein OXH63_08995 [Gemmatimonadetes bacterium]|nr:hypothetical protein [Gemmatimonadota bacterium]